MRTNKKWIIIIILINFSSGQVRRFRRHLEVSGTSIRRSFCFGVSHQQFIFRRHRKGFRRTGKHCEDFNRTSKIICWTIMTRPQKKTFFDAQVFVKLFLCSRSEGTENIFLILFFKFLFKSLYLLPTLETWIRRHFIKN